MWVAKRDGLNRTMFRYALVRSSCEAALAQKMQATKNESTTFPSLSQTGEGRCFQFVFGGSFSCGHQIQWYSSLMGVLAGVAVAQIFWVPPGSLSATTDEIDIS